MPPFDACQFSRRGLLAGAGAAAFAGDALAALPRRRDLLLRCGAIVSVDSRLGVMQNSAILIRDGRIEAVGPDVRASGAAVIEAGTMIAMPGFVETHWHMWSSLGRNFIADGVEYFDAKRQSAPHFEPLDFYRSDRLALAEAANAGLTTVHNFAHNIRSPAHADAELRAHSESGVRALYSYGNIDGLARDKLIDIADLDRVRGQWFGAASPFEGRVRLGMNLRGPNNSDAAVFAREMGAARERNLRVAIHAGQGARPLSAVDLKAQGWLDRNMLLVHFLKANAADRAAMAATGSSLSLSMHSEMRLGPVGDVREQMLQMLADNVNVSFSLDANSLAPVNMFEAMRLAWAMGIPWTGTPTEKIPPLSISGALKMATLNGAKALGWDDEIGSITPGKRADILLIRADDLNMAPRGDAQAALVASGNVENIDTVIVDGRILKRRGVLQGLDVARIKAEAALSAAEIRRRAGGRLAAT